MAACLITAGFVCADCTSAFQVPGLVRDRVYIANFSDVTSTTEATTGEISNIAFASYTGLYKICIHENSGSVSEELSINENAGAFYTQTFSARVIDDSTSVRNAINSFVGAQVIIIAKSKDGDYYILGLDGGLTMSANTYSTGSKAGDETGDIITFTGVAKGKRKKFFNTSAAQTTTMVNTYTMS